MRAPTARKFPLFSSLVCGKIHEIFFFYYSIVIVGLRNGHNLHIIHEIFNYHDEKFLELYSRLKRGDSFFKDLCLCLSHFIYAFNKWNFVIYETESIKTWQQHVFHLSLMPKVEYDWNKNIIHVLEEDVSECQKKYSNLLMEKGEIYAMYFPVFSFLLFGCKFMSKIKF